MKLRKIALLFFLVSDLALATTSHDTITHAQYVLDYIITYIDSDHPIDNDLCIEIKTIHTDMNAQISSEFSRRFVGLTLKFLSEQDDTWFESLERKNSIIS